MGITHNLPGAITKRRCLGGPSEQIKYIIDSLDLKSSITGFPAEIKSD